MIAEPRDGTPPVCVIVVCPALLTGDAGAIFAQFRASLTAQDEALDLFQRNGLAGLLHNRSVGLSRAFSVG